MHVTAPIPVRAMADVRQIDEAVDYAARVCKATASEFLAAPSVTTDPTAPSIDLAVEFFVPPTCVNLFADELDRALARRSMPYAAARRAGDVVPLRVTVIPPGSFHQWRSAWKVLPRAQHDRRWSADRQMLDGLIRQARTGWRELAPIG